MISADTGSIRISEALEITSDASPADLEEQALRRRDGWNDRDGHKWTILSLEPFMFEERSIYSTFRFRDGSLFSADFAISEERFGGSKWADYSEEKEMERKSDHDRFLNDILGSTRDFPWGTVWSEFDVRSGGSSFGVRYNNREQAGGHQPPTRAESK